MHGKRVHLDTLVLQAIELLGADERKSFQELADEARRLRRVGHRMAEQVRYGERSTAERVNGGLKDNHGGRTVRVRGPEKVMCHLMFGILSFTVLQLVRLVT